jgi:hypothetical protein
VKSSGPTATFYSGVPEFETPITSREVTLKYKMSILFYISAVSQRSIKRK